MTRPAGSRPAAMRLRAPAPEEASAVLALLAAREQADLGTVESTLAGLREEWGEASFDAVVADDAGIVGYAALRPLDPTVDAEAVYALNEAAFADNPEYEGESLPEFHAEHLEARGLARDLSRIAERDGGGRHAARPPPRRRRRPRRHPRRPSGRAQERPRPRAPAHSFAAFAVAGLRAARLGVSADNAAALGLYEGLGMRRRFRVDGYERPAVDGGRAPA